MGNLGERIRHIREKKLGLNQQDFAEKLGFSKASAISKYELNQREPEIEVLKKIAKMGQVTLDWLLTGEYHIPVEADNYAHIPLYDIRASAGGGAYVDAEHITDVLAFRKEWIANELRVSVKDLSVIFVEGDSMTPTLNPGDIMLVVKDHGAMLQDGIYVIMLDDTLLVKRLQKLLGGKLAIQSDNPNYRPLEVDLKKTQDDFRIIGRVVWAGRRF